LLNKLQTGITTQLISQELVTPAIKRSIYAIKQKPAAHVCRLKLLHDYLRTVFMFLIRAS